MPDGSLFCHREGRLVAAEGTATYNADGRAPVAEAVTRVMVATTFEIPGFSVVSYHGEVFGLVVRSRNLISNLGASAKSIVGGELRGLTRLLTTSRDDALLRARERAHELGANAIVGLRFDASDLGDTATEVVAYGTAVTAIPSPPSP